MSGGLAGLLRARAETNPHVELLRFAAGESLTVADFDRRTDRIGAVLVDLGVGFGDRVAVQAGNTPTLPLLLFAAAKIGAVVVPINAGYRDQDLRHVLDDSGAVVVVLDDDLAESGEAAARGAASVRVALTSSELRAQERRRPAVVCGLGRRRHPGEPAVHVRNHGSAQGLHAHPGLLGAARTHRRADPGLD